MLVEAGVDPAQVNEAGESLLHLAAENGRVELVNSLVDMGVDPCSAQATESPALFWMHAGYSPEAESKLQAANSDIHLEEEERQELLLKAARKGAERMVKLLLERGADVNRQGEHGETALYEAVRKGAAASVVERLIDAGATPQGEDGGSTLLCLAAGRNDLDVMHVLMGVVGQPNPADRTGWTPLHSAAQAGAIDVIRFLLEAGAAPTADRNGVSPLHCAAKSGSADLIQLLLEQGADPTEADGDGKTPLHYGAKYSSANVVHMLLEAGSDATQTDSAGNMPLHYAAFVGDRDTIRLLIETGTDVNAMGAAGRTPLHRLLDNVHPGVEIPIDAMTLLLEAGADVEAADVEGKAPLHVASEMGYTAAVQELIDAGADVSATDVEGNTPLHLASSSIVRPLSTDNHFRHLRIALALLRAGANPLAASQDGTTPLELARRHGHEPMVQLLRDAGAGSDAGAAPLP
jgi:ankyrin repeat protein